MRGSEKLNIQCTLISPLVFSTSVAMVVYKRLASVLAEKHDKQYSRIITGIYVDVGEVFEMSHYVDSSSRFSLNLPLSIKLHHYHL